MADNPFADLVPAQEVDPDFHKIVGIESGDNQLDKRGKPLTSKAGAIGAAQVMPATAKETAKNAGIDWDEHAYKTDADYNKKLGNAYFKQMKTTFDGDAEKAAAAYNAGPTAVKKAIAKGGDNWRDHLPGETQDYIKKFKPNEASAKADPFADLVPKKATPTPATKKGGLFDDLIPNVFGDKVSDKSLSDLIVDKPATQNPLTTFGSHAVTGVPGAMVGVAAGAYGAELGATAGVPLAPFTAGLSIPAGAILGSLIGYGVGSWAGGTATHALLPDQANKYLEEGEQQNKYSAFAGDLSSYAGVGGISNPGTLKKGAILAAGGLGFEGANQLKDGKLDVTKLAISAATMPFMGGKPTKLGKISTPSFGGVSMAPKETAASLMKPELFVPKNVKGTPVVDIRKESETAYRERHDHYDEATSTKTGPDAGGVSRTIVSSGTFSDSTGTHTASYSSRDDGGLERTITYEGESPKRETYLELKDGSNIWHDVNKSIPKGAKPVTYSEKIAKDITKDDITGYTERGTPGSVADHISTRTESEGPVRTYSHADGTKTIEVDTDALKPFFDAGHAEKSVGLPKGTFKTSQDYLDFAVHREAIQNETSYNQWKDAHPDYDVEAQYGARKAYFDELGETKLAGNTARHEELLKQGAPEPAVENKANPTSKELHSILYGSKNVGEGLDRIVAGNIGGARAQSLFKILQNNKWVSKATLVLDDVIHPLQLGQYNDNPGMHEVTLRGQADIGTFAHEALHAGTSSAMEHPDNAAISAKFDKLFEGLKATADKSEHWTPENQAAGTAHYGLHDKHEMISEAFSNPKFQKYLKDRSILVERKPTNAWDSFKNNVKEILGLKDKEGSSALDQVMDMTHELMNKDDKFGKWDRTSSIDKFEVKEGSYAKYLNDGALEMAETNPFFNVDSLNIPGIPNDHQGLADFLYTLDHGRAQDDIVNSHIYDDIIKGSSAEQLNKMRTFVEGITTEMSESDMKLYNEVIKPLLASRKSGMEHLMNEGVIPKIELGSTNFPRKLLQMSASQKAEVAARLKEAGVVEHDTFLDKFKNYVKELGGGDMGGFNADMERRRGATEERSLFQLEHSDGSKRVIQVTKSGAVLEWKDGKAKFISSKKDLGDGQVKVGDKIEGGKVIEGAMADIEQHSPYKYNKDALAVLLNSNAELREQARVYEGIKGLRESDLFKTMSAAPGEDMPKDWRVPNSIDKIPALRGYAFPQKMAEVVEDFARVREPSMLTNTSNALIKCMMLNPIAHIFNEGMHLFNARGLTGWVSPAGIGRFSKYGKDAMNSVLQQDEFYRDTIKLGGSLLSPGVRHSELEKSLHAKGVSEFSKTPEFKELALSLGRKPGELFNAISAKSATAMWVTRDMMYMQYLKELMGTKGLSHQEAIQHAEKHMPNYRLPTRVGEKVMGANFGRGLSNVLQNPNVSVFSRYHYGMVKSLLETAKDVGAIRKGKAGVDQFKEGIDTTAAIVVALSVLYPMMDKMAVALTGNENAKQRRAGPYHLINAIMEVAEGTKDPQAVLSSVFTFNPALQGLVEIGLDRKAYSGQQVYNPQSSPDVIAKDVGTYMAEMNPLYAQGMKAEEDKGGPEEGWATALARQADIIAPSGVKAGKDLQRQTMLQRKGLKHTIKSREGIE